MLPLPDLSAPPEYELVRLSARAELPPDRAGEFQSVASRDLDWAQVIHLASFHRLAPLLAVHLKSLASNEVPADVLRKLQNNVRSQALFVLFLSSEMARLGRALEDEGIRHLVLKGPSLAEAYGSIAKRPFVDNDLYIEREDFPRVAGVLKELGFGETQRTPLQRAGYLLIHGEDSFQRRAGTLVSTVDLHTDVVPIGYSYHEPFDDLYRRSVALDVAGHTVRALNPADLFLALCVNALKDQWNRLRLATDLAEMGSRVEDWDALESLARHSGSMRALHAGLLVTTDEIGAEFPEGLVARAREDRQAAWVATEVRSHFPTFHRNPVMNGADRARFALRTQDGIGGQIRYLTYVALRRLTERFVDPAGWAALRARQSAQKDGRLSEG